MKSEYIFWKSYNNSTLLQEKIERSEKISFCNKILKTKSKIKKVNFSKLYSPERKKTNKKGEGRNNEKKKKILAFEIMKR